MRVTSPRNAEAARREARLDYRDRRRYCALAMEACYVLIRLGRALHDDYRYFERGIVPRDLFHLLTPARLHQQLRLQSKGTEKIVLPEALTARLISVHFPHPAEEITEKNLSNEPISPAPSTKPLHKCASAATSRLCYPESSQCSPVPTPAAIATITRWPGLLRPERTANQDSDRTRPAGDGGFSLLMRDFN
jgi:hypothetical protein